MKQAFDYFQSNINEVIGKISGLPNLSESKKKAKIQEELSSIRDKILSLKLIFTALENDDDAYIGLVPFFETTG